MQDIGAAPSKLPVPAVCLVILDGWGLAEAGPGNAVALAHTPVFDKLWSSFAHTTLTACGTAVGLPAGQMGNSEVGHLNLGAGAIVKQDLVRIDETIAAGELGSNEVLRSAFDAVERAHLIGLVSDGGVHSSLAHLHALIALGRSVSPNCDLVVHAFTDGRDTSPHSGEGFLAEVDAAEGARVGSVIGRYFAMDRDGRWERTQQAYDLLVHGRAQHAAESGAAAVRAAYARGETDEFITATAVGAEARIRPGDSVICFNFRPDRMREIVRALADPAFLSEQEASGQPRAATPRWRGRDGAAPVSRVATLTQYEEGWPYPVAFAPARPKLTLAQVLADAGARQLHVAETEKYPHVTYFFNGGKEEAWAGERRELVPSPRDVPTYDLKPEMSAEAATDAFTGAWRADQPRFGLINFANADMVGHTGVIPAAVSAVETVDRCLARIVHAVHDSGGACIVTADHGNSDHMLNADGSPNTAHSLNLVPCVITAQGLSLRSAGGVLADIAPTVLHLLGISLPAEMTGHSLLAGDD